MCQYEKNLETYLMILVMATILKLEESRMIRRYLDIDLLISNDILN